MCAKKNHNNNYNNKNCFHSITDTKKINTYTCMT